MAKTPSDVSMSGGQTHDPGKLVMRHAVLSFQILNLGEQFPFRRVEEKFEHGIEESRHLCSIPSETLPQDDSGGDTIYVPRYSMYGAISGHIWLRISALNCAVIGDI